MFINRKIFKQLVKKVKFYLFVLIFITLFVSAPAVTVAETCVPNPDAVVLNIPIPGMNLVYNSACNYYEFRGDSEGNLFVEYVKALYKFLVGIAGILTVFMIMFGGVQWIFSGGNSSKISAAKETILGATIGLFLALGSYTLLRTINPQLTNLNFKVVPVNLGAVGIHNADGSCIEAEDIPCGVTCLPTGSIGEPVIGACKFCQPSRLSGVSCGDTLRSSNFTVNDGNCIYSSCYSSTASSPACVYASEYKEPNQYAQPACQNKLPLIFEQDGNQVQKFFKADHYGKCGEIYWQDSLFNKYIFSTDCDYNKTCVIDFSKGYKFTHSMDKVDLPSGITTEVGHFYSAKCIQ